MFSTFQELTFEGYPGKLVQNCLYLIIPYTVKHPGKRTVIQLGCKVTIVLECPYNMKFYSKHST